MNINEILKTVNRNWAIEPTNIFRLDNGSPNEIWKLDTITKSYTLKHCNFNVSLEWYSFLENVLNKWGERNIPIVKAINTIENQSYCLINNEIYQLREFVEGERFQLNNLNMLMQVAQLTVNIHQENIFGERFISAYNDLEDWLLNAHKNLFFLVEKIESIKLNSESKKEYIDLITKTVEFLSEHFSYYDYMNLPKAITHGELHHTNILFRNERLSNLIDYDSIQVRPRMYDVSRASLFLSRKRRGEFDVNENFVFQYINTYFNSLLISDEEFESIPYILLYYFVPTANYVTLMNAANQLDWYIPWTIKGINFVKNHFTSIIRDIQILLKKRQV